MLGPGCFAAVQICPDVLPLVVAVKLFADKSSEVMAVAEGRRCSSAASSEVLNMRVDSAAVGMLVGRPRIGSASLSLQCQTAMMQSRWRRAMDRPPRSQEPSVLRDCHVHEAMTPRD